jgi:hypothetical protein
MTSTERSELFRYDEKLHLDEWGCFQCRARFWASAKVRKVPKWCAFCGSNRIQAFRDIRLAVDRDKTLFWGKDDK